MEKEAKDAVSGLSTFLVLKFRETVKAGASEGEKWGCGGGLRPLL